MANDSTNAGQVSSDQDSTQIQDGYFTDMQGEDAFFGPEQLAQAGAGGAPVVVPVPQDQNVIRVQVNPGEIIELSSPFDAGATLLGREADGNLAIRVGDVTVILVGFVDANAAAPVVVETSNGQPIDIAVLLASTDPTIDIQTAAGPGDAPGAQGADNTGAILAQLNGGNGLGGLNAVGAQDQTELSYRNIDNAIRLDREDALLGLTGSSFKGLAEPFLRDPAHTNSASWLTFDDFKNEYVQYIDSHQATKGGWADFTGTQATNGASAAFFLDTSFTVEVPHSSATPEQLNLRVGTDFFNGDVPTSNGETLVAEYLGGAFGDKSTIVLVRPSDGAVVMVFHVQESESTGSFHVEVYLVNRLDHHAEGQDVLSVGFNTDIYTPPAEGEETQGATQPGPNGSVDILDDVPVARDVEYTSYKGEDEHGKDYGKKGDSNHHDSIPTTEDGKAYVDEDWVKHGNKDTDNNPSGANADDAHGDTIGRAIAKGNLNIDFGADGPAGADGNDCTFDQGSGSTLVLAIDTSVEAGFVNADGHVLDSKGNVVTSHGHELVILSDTVDSHGIERLIVGYTVEHAEPTENSDLVFAAAAESEGSCDVAVFELTLDLNPDDVSGKGMHFQDFKFELFKALDQDPNTPTIESNTDLQFKVVGHDDDGDTVHTAINIAVNDDSPTFEVTYDNEDPRNCDVRAEVSAFGGDGYGYVDHYKTKDFGHVDEDWLNGGVSNDGQVIFANGPGNHDKDGNGVDNADLYGDDKGGLEVCGQIKVKYGADGPSDAPNNGALALKTYVVPASAPYPAFENGDAAGSHLTSDGKTLVVLVSNEGHLVVGVPEYSIPPHDGFPFTVVPAQYVFELTLNQDTGKFDFKLWGAIDHVPATVGGDPESNLVLSFSVGSAEDFDHDTALGAINIKVNDDKPEVGITYCNELPGQIFALGIDVATKHDTDYGRIDEDWLQGAVNNDGSIDYVPIGNQDRDANYHDNANQLGDDYGSSHLSGQITMKYGADGPGTQSIGLATLAAATDADNNQLTTQGGTIPLVVLHSTSDEIRIGYSDENGDHTVFLLTLDSSGHFDFTQFEPIDHPIASAIEDNVYLTFKAGSITDGDGDTTDAVIKIQVNDDVPETAVSYTNVGPEKPPVETDSVITYGAPVNFFGSVDEDYLPKGNKDADNSTPGDPSDSVRGDEEGYTIVTGSIGGGTKYGADGPLGTPTNIFVLSGFDQDAAVTDADGNPLSSHGHLLVVLTSSDGTLEVGYHNGEDPDTKVFTLEMTSATEFKFELKEPLDEPQHKGDSIEQGIVLVFGAEDTGAPTDKDSDPAARIVIHVNDDAPTLCEVNYLTYSDISGEDPINTGAGYGLVDEDHLPDGLRGNLDTDNDPHGNSDPVRGDTLGGYHADGRIVVKFGADGPADNAFTLDSYKEGKTFKDACNNTFESHGHTLKVLEADATHISVGYKDGSVTTEVFNFHVNQDGTFSLVFFEPLDHPSSNPLEDNLKLVFDVTASDFDGDSVSTKVEFKVNDDAPGEAELKLTGGDGENIDGRIYGTIDEDWVISHQGKMLGNQDTDTGTFPNGEYPDGPGKASVEIQVTVPFGADGPAEHPYSLEIQPEQQPWMTNGGYIYSKFDPAPWDQPTPAPQDLDPLVVLSSTPDKLVIGHAAYFDDTTSGIDFYTVLTVILDRDTGKTTTTLYQGIDQQESTDQHGNVTSNETSIPLTFNVTATDFDGDTSTTEVIVKVNDDRPSAVADDATITSSDHLLLIGNVFTNDKGTADGVLVTAVGGQAMDSNGQVVINTEYGKLIVADDGLYNFTANKSNGATSVNLGYSYDVVDGDGDTSSAFLRIHIPAFEPSRGTVVYEEGESLPNPNNNNQYESWGAVDEDWVPGGNKDDNSTGGEGNYPGDGPGKDSATATVTIANFGVDGPAEHPFSLFVETVGEEFRESLHGGIISSQFDTNALVVISSSATELVVGHKGQGTSGKVFTLTLDQDTGVATLKMFQGIQSFPGDDNEESGATLGFTVVAMSAGGEQSGTTIQFRVNDDRPVGHNDDGYVPAYFPGGPSDPTAIGNIFLNDTGKGDGMRVTKFAGIDMPSSGQINFDNSYGHFVMDQDGLWNFISNKSNTSEVTIYYDYFAKDGDGDTTAATLVLHIPAPATHVPPADFDYTATLNQDFDANTSPGHVAGQTTMIVDGDGSHTLTGDATALNVIYGNGGDDTIIGGSAGDILLGGDGKDTLKGGGGDDTLYGGNNDDDFYGEAGHDAMSGGAGNDTFHNVDDEDLTNTNLLDGSHSIDGGDGTDTVQLGGIGEFFTQAARVQNVEVLDFKANSAGNNEGTAVTLDYNAVYGITQVGGLHALTIHADKAGDPGADFITLKGDSGHSWSAAVNDGTYNTYTAGTGAAQVTVHIDQDASVIVA